MAMIKLSSVMLNVRISYETAMEWMRSINVHTFAKHALTRPYPPLYMSSYHETVLILDFGGQYTQLIARRIRELGVYSEILPCTQPLDQVLAAGYKGLVLSGGPSS